MIVRPYDRADAPAWDEVIAGSQTGTLLQTRRFLGYHGDRFDDVSVVLEDDGIAHVLPLARVDAMTAVSHPGATHGGLVSRAALGLEDALAIFGDVRLHLLALGVTRLRYTPIPHVFHRVVSEVDTVALSMLGARVIRQLPNAVLDLDRMTLRRRQNRARARRAGCTSCVLDDVACAHALIVSTLARRHDVAPVHSLGELEWIASAFPEDVLVIGTMLDQVLVATLVIFRLGDAMHVQYMASSEQGFAVQALDHGIGFLCETVMSGRGRLSFGVSVEPDGTTLNPGLMRFKEMFGANVQSLDRYEWDLLGDG